ncbi:MAG: hypothetical protein C5B49_02220 [Bdellovibrio sp.]|nr:MAG: hypothetical protein C5B49_02220 [Bdellovibrio sp.]
MSFLKVTAMNWQRSKFWGQFWPLRKLSLFLILLTIAVSLGPIHADHYNNFLIFRASFFHLLQGQNLYGLFPADHFDYYKYSPTFALLMAPWALFPTAIGAVLWNLVGVLAMLLAVAGLPLGNKEKSLLIWMVLPEWIGSMQNFQSNCLMAALVAGCALLLERNRVVWAACLVALAIHIKIFGVVAVVLAATHPRRWVFAAALVGWTLGLAILPLVFLTSSQLLTEYGEWFHLLRWDNAQSVGYSVMGIWEGLTGQRLPNLPVQLAGALGLCLPVVLQKIKTQQDRMIYLGQLLIWLVIFNHKSESPTFVIAMFGFGIWYFFSPRGRPQKVMVFLTLLMVSVFFSDVFPKGIRNDYVEPLAMKAWPLFATWLWSLGAMVWPASVSNECQSAV